MPLPEGSAGIELRGSPGRASNEDGHLCPGVSCRCRRRPISCWRGPSTRRRKSRRGRSATTSVITASRTISPSCGLRRCFTAKARSGRSRRSAGPRKRTRRSARLIHELTGPIVPTVLPGVHAVHAVDAAGVHPLLLAVASERYVPYARTSGRPQETAHQRQRHSRAGADVAGQVSVYYRQGGRSRPLDPRHPRPSSGTSWNGSTGRTTCTSRRGRRWIRSTTRATA